MTTDALQGRSSDDAFDALADRQRRVLLLSLLEENPQADESPASQPDGGSGELGVLVSMRHVHLPKLADYGFVEWDRDAAEVRTGPRFEDIVPLLELFDEHRDELPAGWL